VNIDGKDVRDQVIHKEEKMVELSNGKCND